MYNTSLLSKELCETCIKANFGNIMLSYQWTIILLCFLNNQVEERVSVFFFLRVRGINNKTRETQSLCSLVLLSLDNRTRLMKFLIVNCEQLGKTQKCRNKRETIGHDKFMATVSIHKVQAQNRDL